MPLAAESSDKTMTSAIETEISDSEWLIGNAFRHSTPANLSVPGRQGDVAAFSKLLPVAYEELCKIGKRERARMLGSLATLWKLPGAQRVREAAEGSLVSCLFDRELTSDELSGRVEAIMTSTGAGLPDRETLVAAFWMLRLSGNRLEPQTRFALFRWTMDQSREWLKRQLRDHASKTDPENGCDAFDFLEIQVLHALSFPGLKGMKKQHQLACGNWRKALDAITDGDGAPHARWLSEIVPRFCQLASANLFADSLNLPLWDKKSRRRQEGLLARTALLITPTRVAFSPLTPGEASSKLLAIAKILQLHSRPGLLSLLSQWEKQAIRPRMGNTKELASGKLPKASHQSDWAEWASLRTSWQGQVDDLTVRYEGAMPQLEVVVRNQPLFAGAWAHELKIAGKPVTTQGDWSCCCWYLDKEAAFIELQLDLEGTVQMIRQALLMPKDSVLMIADSIRTPEPEKIEWTRRLPLCSGWQVEEDTLSRESALVNGETRVRVFPLSGPQMRIERSEETVSFQSGEMKVTSQTAGRGLYVSTIFDWSDKRREEPVDWTRVTVAQDGKMQPPDVAVGHRLRIGKKQWVLYHSLQKPPIPRTVMGLHTLSETVFAKFTPQGEIEPVVEVEL